MEKNIENFIKKYSNNKFLSNYLTEILSPLAIDYYQNEELNKINELKHQQQILHIELKKEIKSLFDFAQKNHIRLTGFKGLFLYEQSLRNDFRKYYDIDILIHPDDIIKLKDYFTKEKNYHYVGKIIPWKKFKRLYKINNKDLSKTHHLVIRKPLENCELKVIDYVEFEFHTNLNAFKASKFDNNKMLNNKVRINDYYTLNIEDHLLFLSYHTIQHLPFVIHDISPFYVKLDRFYDFYALVKSQSINWNKFIKHAESYGICCICYFFLKMYIEVFPNSVPSYVLRELLILTKKENIYWRGIFNYILTKDPIDLILGNYNNSLLSKKYNKIQRLFGNLDRFLLFRKITMELWKKELKKINSYYLKIYK